MRQLTLIKNVFVRDVAVTFAAQIVSLLLAIIYSAVLGRWLGSEGKGILELVILLPSMLGLFLSGGIGVANVYYAGSGRLDIPSLTSHSVGFALLATLLGASAITMMALTGLLGQLLPGIPFSLLLLAMVGLPLELLGGYFRTILQGSQHIVAVNIVNLLRVTLLVSLTVLLMISLRRGLYGAVFAQLIAVTIQLVGLIYLLRQHGAVFMPRWDRSTMRKLLGFGLRGHVGNVLQFYNYRLDVFLVNFILGPASVGLYNVSARMAEVLWFLPNAVGFVIMPKAAGTSPAEMNSFTPRVFRATFLMTMIGSVVLILLGKPIIRIIYTTEFIGAFMPMLLLLPGVVLLGSGKVLTNEIAGRGFPQYNAINSAVALALTFLLDFLLIPRYGLSGAAAASSVSYSVTFVTAVLFYLYLRRNTVAAVVDVDSEATLL